MCVSGVMTLLEIPCYRQSGQIMRKAN